MNQVLVLSTVEHPLGKEGTILQIRHIFFAKSLVSPADQGRAVRGNGIVFHGRHEGLAVRLQHSPVLSQIFILGKVHKLSVPPLFEQLCVISLGEIDLRRAPL